MTEFQDKVFKLVRKIPKGKISTYKIIAERLDNPGAARAVGNALNKNENLFNTPCFKVVRSNGRLGGYTKGQNQKASLLKREGIGIRNNKIVNLSKYLYKEL